METIDSDIQEIINDEVEKNELKQFILDVIKWEDKNLHKSRRRGKTEELNEALAETMKDW